MLGDADTVFADGNTMAAYAEANGNIRRNNIEYADNAARNAAQKALHDRMVNEGKILDLTENRENVSQYFPNLRSMPKAERAGLLREKIQTLKNDLRTYLNQLKGVNFEFEINGNTIEATVYNAGVKEVLQNLTQDKAGMLSASEEIFRNAEYLYSTQDKTGSPNVTGWDYFYVPVKIGGDTVGVRIAIRNMAFPTESQIYNWGIKREDTSLDGVGLMPGGRTSADVSSDVSSTATIRQTEGNSQEKSSGKASVVDQDGNYINIKNEAPGNTKTGVTVQDGVTRGPKASSDAIVHSDTGDSQEKSSGRAGVEVSGINNRTAAELGDVDTVFADENGVSMTYDSNDAAQFNPEGKTQDELLRDIMDSAEPLDRRYLYFGRFTDSFRIAMEKAGVEVKNLPVIMSYRDAYLAMESRENGRYQGGNINYHNLGIEGMKRAMENIGKPDAVIKSKKDGKIELFLDFVDYKGNRGLAIVQLDSNAQHSIVTSIYGRSRGDAYLEKAKSEGRLVYSKEEGPAQGMAQVQYKSDINAKPSSTDTIRQTEGNSQEKSSGKASVEVPGINNRTAAELDGADTVFADGSISVLSEEARYEILKDRTIRPASVEYDKLGDTDTAVIYDSLSAAQIAQAKKAIRAIAKKLGLHQVDLKNSRIEFPFRFSNANAGASAQHQSEYGGLYMTVAMTKIKESDVVKKLQAGESAAATSLLSDSNISIQDIFRSVKAGDGRFLKYAPDAFLNDAQNAAKRRAIQRQTGEGASYKIDGNGRASVEVKNRNTETSEEDARRDFSPAGEPPRVHLAADSFCSITHALMPQKLRLRRNRSAFFCPRQRQTAFPSVQILSRKAYTKKDSLPHRAGNPFWYARRDLNPRPLAPEANTLSS